MHVRRVRLTNQAHPQPGAAVVERNQKEQMKKNIERAGTPAVAVQRSVSHHDEPTMRAMTTNTAAWYDASTGEVVVCAFRMKVMKKERDQLLKVLNEILECSNGHFNPLFKCQCYEKAHALVLLTPPLPL